MITKDYQFSQHNEERIARLTQAAYQAILERGFRGSFLDLELSLWETIRQAVEQDHGLEIEAI